MQTPDQWLSNVNPGFGPNPNLGLSFFTNNVPAFVISVLVFLLIVGSLIFLLYGGILWITSSGNKEGLTKAKNTIMYAVIGLALGILSFAFINILGTFFGVNLIGS